MSIRDQAIQAAADRQALQAVEREAASLRKRQAMIAACRQWFIERIGTTPDVIEPRMYHADFWLEGMSGCWMPGRSGVSLPTVTLRATDRVTRPEGLPYQSVWSQGFSDLASLGSAIAAAEQRNGVDNIGNKHELIWQPLPEKKEKA